MKPLFRKLLWVIALSTASLLLTSCGGSGGDSFNISSPLLNDGSASTYPAPVYSYRVINTYPHQRDAFTEGLVFANGKLYESNGLIGQSNLREIDLESGQVLRQATNAPNQFSEGLALRSGNLYQLTLNQGVANRWDLASFGQAPGLSAPKPAWGLTYNPQTDRFLMSDGSSKIYTLSPTNLEVESSVNVTDNGQPVARINELELVKGAIFANRFLTDEIIAVNPDSGVVLFRIDLSGIINKTANGLGVDDVLNGIAYDQAGDRLFVTGKRWPFLYEIEIVNQVVTP